MESHGLVDIRHDMTRHDRMRLRLLIEQHLEYTGSEVAQRILEDWSKYASLFVKVMPVDYRQALEKMQTRQSRPPMAQRPLVASQSQKEAVHG